MLARARRWRTREGWDEFVWILAAVTLLAAIVFFIELADDAPEGDYLEIERTIMLAMRDPATGLPAGPPWIADAVRDITALGSAAVLILFAILVLGYLALVRRYRTILFTIVAIGGGEALNWVLKEAFARQRPSITPHLVQVHSLSFPSGHAMGSSIFYLTVGALLAQTVARRREKAYLVSAAVLLTVVAGWSRVYLGVHYPTDVLGGWAVGTAWAIACWMVARWMRARGALRAVPETPPR